MGDFKMYLQEVREGTWTRMIWLRIGICCGLLWMR